jgi:hypothetical protein
MTRKNWKSLLLSIKLHPSDSFHLEFNSYVDFHNKRRWHGKIVRWNMKTGDGSHQDEWEVKGKHILKAFPDHGLTIVLRLTPDCEETKEQSAGLDELPFCLEQWIENHLEINSVPKIFYDYESGNLQANTHPGFSWEEDS